MTISEHYCVLFRFETVTHIQIQVYQLRCLWKTTDWRHRVEL